MLFNYKERISILLIYSITFFITATSAFSLSTMQTSPSAQKIQILATSANEDTRAYIQVSSQRMKKYKAVILKALKKEPMTSDLFVIPLVESNFLPLDFDNYFFNRKILRLKM